VGRVRVVTGAGLLLVALLLLADPAGAQGACSATVNGVDAITYSSPGDALEVSEDEVLAIAADAPGPGAYDVKLEFAGIGWSVASDEYDGDSWADDVEVGDYADKGTGIYKAVATSTGTSSCSATAFFKITGVSPLSTLAGKAAAGAAVVGTAGSVLAAVRVAGKAAQAAAGASSSAPTTGVES
jgi:hypothetical protein